MDRPVKFIQSNRNVGRNRNGSASHGIKGVERQDIKTQKFASSNTVYTQPHFYSPMHTPQNWQIPSRREEIYQWLLLPGNQLLTEHGIYVNIEDFDFVPNEIIEDSVTGGLLYNSITCPPVVSGKGNVEIPTRFSIRECNKKECYRFSSTGYFRNFAVSEEHGIYVIDGDDYRRRKKIQGDNIYRLKTCESSIWATTETSFDNLITKKEARDVKLNDYLLMPIRKFRDNPINLDRDLSWSIGLLQADGHLWHADGNGFNICYTLNKDEMVYQEIKNVLNKITNNTVQDTVHTSSVQTKRIVVSEKLHYQKIQKYTTGKHSEKCFTKDVFDLDKESMLHILAGYIDGDGSFSKREKKIIINCYSENMSEQLQQMFLMCGIKCSLKRYPLYGDHYKTNSKWCYRIFISSSCVPEIQKYMRSEKIPTDFVPKKERELRFFYEENENTFISSPIEKIEKFLYSGPGYDLEIPVDRSYCCSGFYVSNCRFFVENEPKVAAAIQFYSEFPQQGFELQCPDPKIKRYYEELNKRLNLNYWLPIISAEYYLLGDVFPFLTVNCPKCYGTGVLGDKECDHKGGTFTKLHIWNPDWIDVKEDSLFNEPYIQLKPNEEMRRLVMDKQPLHIYNRIPEHIRMMVMAGQPIPLSNRCVSHLKHMPSPVTPYGTSIIRRLFKTLAYKDRLMTANWIVAERLILPIRIIKIGNDERPAGAIDIANVQEQIASVMNDPNLTLVTHHAFEYQYIGAQGQIVQLSAEYEMITKEILDGLMLPQAVLNAEMQGYQGVQIGAEILITRLEAWRNKLKDFIEQKIYLPIAKMQGFIDEDASKDLGDIIYVYPEIKWNDLKIRDDTQRKQQYLGLHDAGILSTQTLSEIFDLDYDQEIERKREEASIQMSLGGGMQGAMGGMAGGPGGMPPMPPMGGGGGGMPPMPPMGGGPAGGGPAGAGGAPEVPGGTPPVAASTMAHGTTGKILKRKTKRSVERKQDLQKQQQFAYPAPQVQLTSIERILWRKLFNDTAVNIPFPKYSQYKVANTEGQPYVIDFAIPNLKIGIEADGALHQLPENKVRDTERDKKLARKGWLILRFNEREIENKTEQVIQTIMKYVGMKLKMMRKESSSLSKKEVIGTITRTLSDIIDSQDTDEE